ncbi:MAG: YbaB/EbfC family nucleoid-associated protein [Sciscionella sp.]
MEPNQIAGDYRREAAELGARAEAAKSELQRITGTLTSKDGAVTVTVNTSGALQNLSFHPKAESISHTALAATVLDTARRAQLAAARQVTTAMAPLIGNDSDAMRFLQEQVPEPEVEDEQPDLEQQRSYNSEQEHAAAERPVPRRSRRPRPRDDYEDDEMPHSIFEERPW